VVTVTPRPLPGTAAGLAVGLGAAAVTRDHEELRTVGHPEQRDSCPDRLVVHRQRADRVDTGPHEPFGVLMLAVGFAFVAALEAANHALPFSIGRALAALWIGIFFQALLSPLRPVGSVLAPSGGPSGSTTWASPASSSPGSALPTSKVAPTARAAPTVFSLVADKLELAKAILIVEQPPMGGADPAHRPRSPRRRRSRPD
jgi:hypothetical protein